MTRVETLAWPAEWPQFDAAALPRLNGHQAMWISSIAKGLRQQVYLLRAREDDLVTGVLPLHLVKGPLFGRFLVSLPYVNTGGIWARDLKTANKLLDVACELADKLDVRYLELRHEQAIEHARLNYTRTDKVHMRLALPSSAEALMASYKSKLRSQIKKAGQNGLTVAFGGLELLDDFYGVFGRNMRDLGTPVFPKALFVAILEAFEGRAELCVVRDAQRPLAGGLLVHGDGVSEVPSASSLREYNRLGANMWMYRHLLERAIEKGSHTFDFGRSSEDSGTYKFKAQWGANPYPACWQYYVRHGSPEQMRPEASGKRRLVRVWQRLPVWLTNTIGPPIVRGIP